MTGKRKRRAGILAGVVAAGVGAAIAAERLIRRDQERPDAEADEPLGELHGTSVGPLTAFDGTALHVEEMGSGPTIVLVHGFALAMGTWHYQMRDLSQDFRLVLYDQRGHGRSGAPPGGDFSLQALARDLDIVIQAAAGDGPVVVVGHSMGGMTALEYAKLFPEAIGTRVCGLVLCDTTAADVMAGVVPFARRFGAAAQAVQEAAMTALTKPDRFTGRVDWTRERTARLGYVGVRLMGFGVGPSPSQVSYVQRLNWEAPAETWLGCVRGMLGLDVLDACAAIDVPALVICGTKDRLTPPGAAERIAETIKDAELAWIEGAGHMAMMERPHAFNARLRAFLSKIPAFARVR